MGTFDWIRLILGCIFLIIGLVIFFTELFGVFHFHYVLNRMHAAAMGDTLGIASCLIGSCKYRNAPVDTDELELMEEYAEAMGHFGRKYYYLFSKSGFTDELTTRAEGEKEKVRLITLEDMYQVFP